MALYSYRKTLMTFMIVAFTCLLTACGYHLRSSKTWPTALKTVQIQSDTLSAQANATYIALLHALNVHITSQASYILVFDHYTFKQSLPTTISSNLPIVVSATASVQYHVALANGKICIPTTTLSSTYQQSEPSSTLLVNSIDPEVQQRLLQNLSELFYQRITSFSTKSLLQSDSCAIKPVITTHRHQGKASQ